MNRDYALDIAKIIAMLLVAWGHIVGTVSYEYNSIPLVINSNTCLPLLPVETHSLWQFESFFHHILKIQFAVVGVIIFFIISGMFIPYMQEKYENKSNSKFFLFAHCYKRVFLPLSISVLFITFIEKYIQGINFSWIQILTSGTATSSLFSVVPVTGVMWFLIVLCVMWLISGIYQKYTVKNIFVLYIICLFFTVLPSLCETKFNDALMVIAYNARMIGIILLGILWTVTKGFRIIDRIVYMSLATGFCLVTLNAYEVLYKFPETYDRISSYACALVIILIGYLIFFLINKLPFDGVKSYFIRCIEFISQLFLPFYLCHVCVGLNTLYLFRSTTVPAWIRVFTAFVASLLVANLVIKVAKGIKFLYDKILEKIKC